MYKVDYSSAKLMMITFYNWKIIFQPLIPHDIALFVTRRPICTDNLDTDCRMIAVPLPDGVCDKFNCIVAKDGGFGGAKVIAYYLALS